MLRARHGALGSGLFKIDRDPGTKHSLNTQRVKFQQTNLSLPNIQNNLNTRVCTSTQEDSLHKNIIRSFSTDSNDKNNTNNNENHQNDNETPQNNNSEDTDKDTNNNNNQSNEEHTSDLQQNEENHDLSGEQGEKSGGEGEVGEQKYEEAEEVPYHLKLTPSDFEQDDPSSVKLKQLLNGRSIDQLSQEERNQALQLLSKKFEFYQKELGYSRGETFIEMLEQLEDEHKRICEEENRPYQPKYINDDARNNLPFTLKNDMNRMIKARRERDGEEKTDGEILHDIILSRGELTEEEERVIKKHQGLLPQSKFIRKVVPQLKKLASYFHVVGDKIAEKYRDWYFKKENRSQFLHPDKLYRVVLEMRYLTEYFEWLMPIWKRQWKFSKLRLWFQRRSKVLWMKLKWFPVTFHLYGFIIIPYIFFRQIWRFLSFPWRNARNASYEKISWNRSHFQHPTVRNRNQAIRTMLSFWNWNISKAIYAKIRDPLHRLLVFPMLRRQRKLEKEYYKHGFWNRDLEKDFPVLDYRPPSLRRGVIKGTQKMSRLAFGMISSIYGAFYAVYHTLFRFRSRNRLSKRKTTQEKWQESQDYARMSSFSSSLKRVELNFDQRLSEVFEELSQYSYGQIARLLIRKALNALKNAPAAYVKLWKASFVFIFNSPRRLFSWATSSEKRYKRLLNFLKVTIIGPHLISLLCILLLVLIAFILSPLAIGARYLMANSEADPYPLRVRNLEFFEVWKDTLLDSFFDLTWWSKSPRGIPHLFVEPAPINSEGLPPLSQLLKADHLPKIKGSEPQEETTAELDLSSAPSWFRSLKDLEKISFNTKPEMVEYLQKTNTQLKKYRNIILQSILEGNEFKSTVEEIYKDDEGMKQIEDSINFWESYSEPETQTVEGTEYVGFNDQTMDSYEYELDTQQTSQEPDWLIKWKEWRENEKPKLLAESKKKMEKGLEKLAEDDSSSQTLRDRWTEAREKLIEEMEWIKDYSDSDNEAVSDFILNTSAGVMEDKNIQELQTFLTQKFEALEHEINEKIDFLSSITSNGQQLADIAAESLDEWKERLSKRMQSVKNSVEAGMDTNAHIVNLKDDLSSFENSFKERFGTVDSMLDDRFALLNFSSNDGIDADERLHSAVEDEFRHFTESHDEEQIKEREEQLEQILQEFNERQKEEEIHRNQQQYPSSYFYETPQEKERRELAEFDPAQGPKERPITVEEHFNLMHDRHGGAPNYQELFKQIESYREELESLGFWQRSARKHLLNEWKEDFNTFKNDILSQVVGNINSIENLKQEYYEPFKDIASHIRAHQPELVDYLEEWDQHNEASMLEPTRLPILNELDRRAFILYKKQVDENKRMELENQDSDLAYEDRMGLRNTPPDKSIPSGQPQQYEIGGQNIPVFTSNTNEPKTQQQNQVQHQTNDNSIGSSNEPIPDDVFDQGENDNLFDFDFGGSSTHDDHEPEHAGDTETGDVINDIEEDTHLPSFDDMDEDEGIADSYESNQTLDIVSQFIKDQRLPDQEQEQEQKESQERIAEEPFHKEKQGGGDTIHTIPDGNEEISEEEQFYRNRLYMQTPKQYQEDSSNSIIQKRQYQRYSVKQAMREQYEEKLQKIYEEIDQQSKDKEKQIPDSISRLESSIEFLKNKTAERENSLKDQSKRLDLASRKVEELKDIYKEHRERQSLSTQSAKELLTFRAQELDLLKDFGLDASDLDTTTYDRLEGLLNLAPVSYNSEPQARYKELLKGQYQIFKYGLEQFQKKVVDSDSVFVGDIDGHQLHEPSTAELLELKEKQINHLKQKLYGQFELNDQSKAKLKQMESYRENAQERKQQAIREWVERQRKKARINIELEASQSMKDAEDRDCELESQSKPQMERDEREYSKEANTSSLYKQFDQYQNSLTMQGRFQDLSNSFRRLQDKITGQMVLPYDLKEEEIDEALASSLHGSMDPEDLEEESPLHF
eukprot:gb/GECH01014526.1/.p1 GENE.gb/GECH01014526.1/~~gb/GECH01014526.1/.p1  ORF type:complete len:1946 (+),score=450.02 gb/GECH01014526.1/:1-5838(+)